jgi:nucleoside 2-deoxyribosyltransferase
MTQSFSIYFAGELFSLKHLVGNALLADAIQTQSDGRYHCFVPQDHEQRETIAVAIRNQDLLHAATSDLGIYHFDGPELDSGTVAEFMVAKMLDIPSVILRSDFRSGGEAKILPWNLMLVNYPRTEVIVLDSIVLYQKGLHQDGLSPKQAAMAANEQLAAMVIAALDKVRTAPPILSPEAKRVAYENMRLFPGGGFDSILTKEKMEHVLASKLERSL